ncbi:MAG: hypothetical protein JOZ21_06055, partial [Verrucomicrobia bacterium]|nr:hypothetical protein [Verrucomicrobiota bacterium]
EPVPRAELVVNTGIVKRAELVVRGGKVKRAELLVYRVLRQSSAFR